MPARTIAIPAPKAIDQDEAVARPVRRERAEEQEQRRRRGHEAAGEAQGEQAAPGEVAAGRHVGVPDPAVAVLAGRHRGRRAARARARADGRARLRGRARRVLVLVAWSRAAVRARRMVRSRPTSSHRPIPTTVAPEARPRIG